MPLSSPPSSSSPSRRSGVPVPVPVSVSSPSHANILPTTGGAPTASPYIKQQQQAEYARQLQQGELVPPTGGTSMLCRVCFVCTVFAVLSCKCTYMFQRLTVFFSLSPSTTIYTYTHTDTHTYTYTYTCRRSLAFFHRTRRRR